MAYSAQSKSARCDADFGLDPWTYSLQSGIKRPFRSMFYCLKYLRDNSKAVVPIVDMALVSGLLLLEGAIVAETANDRFKLEMVFVFCAIWAFGSALTCQMTVTTIRRILVSGGNLNSNVCNTRAWFDYWLDQSRINSNHGDRTLHFMQ